SVEMIESSMPWYGVMAAPVHSGLGWNSGGKGASLPPQATSMQNGALSTAIARNFMSPPRAQHRPRVSTRSTNACGSWAMSLGDRRRQIVHDAGVRRLAVLLV